MRLARGEAAASDYDALIVKVCETHLLSAHFVAFVFSLAPPGAATSLGHNLLEELGTAGEEAHSALLVRLLDRAGLADREGAARQAGLLRLRDRIMEPLFYGSLREVGLSALVEIVGFEFMLSRMASEFASFLQKYRGLSQDALEWFTHHSEVDLAHAEQGLDAVAEYAEYYELGLQEAIDIADAALEENIYLKRYFGAHTAALSP
jgi:pyrroloquinoline quinone (PQQ) biosynthesis protein C